MSTGTTFEEIYKIFLSKIQDWKQKKLFLTNEQVATALCEEYLKKAVAKFTNCQLNIIEDISAFDRELTLKEKDILTGLMAEAWLDRMILDITQMNLNLNDNDFKHYAESQNLTAKINTRDEIREINAQDMWMYGFDNVPWKEWASGNYAL